jgi:methionyl-tRNA synthetase
MKDSIYLMTAIPYVNAKPHLGHALEFILGDSQLRFYRNLGMTVRGQIGTDEYGQKLERTAKKLNKDPQDYCDLMSEHFKELVEIFDLSYDQYIRTTEKRHHLSTQKLWMEAFKNGDIYKKSYRGLYCTGCESFKVEKDLIKGVCPNHNTKPEEIQEENYFFRLSKYSEQIKKWLETNPHVVFPKTRYNEILNLIKSGLEDISISRPIKSLSWGIPVPNDPEHVMYVWFDALTNYITGVGYAEDQDLFEKYWQSDTKTIHIIGKDIIRHHIAIWPGMLLSAGIKLPTQYIVHGFVTSGGQKMSKSLGNIIDPVDYAKKYGSDGLRWYLLKEIPNGQDGDFIADRFIEVYNSDLANNIGNLLNRVITLLQKFNISITPNELGSLELEKVYASYKDFFETFRIEKACDQIIHIANQANTMIEEKKPWILAKEDRTELEKVMKSLYTHLFFIQKMSEPIIPRAAKKMKLSLGIDNGLKITRIEPIFPKIEH